MGEVMPEAFRSREQFRRCPSGESGAVMAVFHSPRPAQLSSVVAGHWMGVVGRQSIATDAVATMLLAGAMPVASVASIQANVAAALATAEENQISRSELFGVVRLHSYWRTEPFLLIGVARQPDALTGKGGLYKARAVKIWPDAAAP